MGKAAGVSLVAWFGLQPPHGEQGCQEVGGPRTVLRRPGLSLMDQSGTESLTIILKLIYKDYMYIVYTVPDI